MDRLLLAAEALTLIAKVTPGRLESSVRSRVNVALDQAGLDGNKSFQTFGQGLAAVGGILGKFGLEWDETLNAHNFRGDSGQATLRIAFTNEADSFSPQSISNSMVRLGWYKHQSGNYEITAYLS
jgi:hypothetical protein